jgi:hypothetical protein
MKRIRYLITQSNINALRAGHYSQVQGPEIGWKPKHFRVCYHEKIPHPCSGKSEKEFYECFVFDDEALDALEAGKQVELDRYSYVKKIMRKNEDKKQ